MDGEDIISSATSVEDIISALARHRCSDLTSLLDLTTCSNLPLAGGGFCDVYRGGMNHGTRIAIKSLRLYDTPGRDKEKEKILKRAAREIYHWSKLTHPNVLPLMGLAMFRGHLSMISEWMMNGSLLSYINLNSGVDRIGLCMDICTGLSYIHKNEMVHGDLKAANVMVSSFGTAMIADFGNARLKDLTLKFTNTTNSSLSVRWAAPELLGEEIGLHASNKADVYAFGMTMLETLTGQVPYSDYSEQQVLVFVALQHKTPDRPASGISDEIWELLRYCWTHDKSERPGIAVVEERLRASIHSLGVTKTHNETSRYDNVTYTLSAFLPDIDGKNGPKNEISRADLERLRSLADLAVRHYNRGQLVEAESLELEVVAGRTQLLGIRHPDTLQSKASLAMTYSKQGRLAEAESLGLEVLQVRKQVLGEDHPATLQSMANLATTYHNQDRLDDAELLGSEVVAARKRVLGVGHPDTLQSMATLAMTYSKQGQLSDGKSLRIQVLAARKRVFGGDHPSTLESMADLAMTYSKQGDLKAAEWLGIQVVAARKRVLGPEHPDTLQSMVNLAITYYKQEQLAQAESLEVDVVAARRELVGAEHPETLEGLANLATTYLKQDQLAQAESLGAGVVAAQKRVLGEDHPDTLESMANLATTFSKQGRLAEAVRLGDELLAARRRVLGATHPDTLQSMANLAVTYYKQGQLVQAESLEVEVVASRKQVLGEDHPDTLRGMHNLALTYKAQGRENEYHALIAQTKTTIKR